MPAVPITRTWIMIENAPYNVMGPVPLGDFPQNVDMPSRRREEERISRRDKYEKERASGLRKSKSKSKSPEQARETTRPRIVFDQEPSSSGVPLASASGNSKSPKRAKPHRSGSKHRSKSG